MEKDLIEFKIEKSFDVLKIPTCTVGHPNTMILHTGNWSVHHGATIAWIMHAFQLHMPQL